MDGDNSKLDDISSITSLGSDVVVVADVNKPRRSSVDSGQVVDNMTEALAESDMDVLSPVTVGSSDPVDSATDEQEVEHTSSHTAGEENDDLKSIGSAGSDVNNSDLDDTDQYYEDTGFSEFTLELRNMSKSDSHINTLQKPPANDGGIQSSMTVSQSAVSSSSDHAPSLAGNTLIGSPKSPANKQDAEFTTFHGVTYLGAAKVNAPRSDNEIKRNMAILNDHTTEAIPICLMIPSLGDGNVRLADPTGESEITSFKLHRILYCSRGAPDSAEKNCFAFTCSHGDTAESAMFQSHVFRCDLADAVGKIMFNFQQAFQRLNRKNSSVPSTVSNPEQLAVYEDNLYTFDVALEIKEDDGKGSMSSCPQDSGVFKLRRDLVKTLTVTLTQTSNKDLRVDRCFGMLVSPGRNIKNSDMHLIEMTSMGYDATSRCYNVTGDWDPKSDNFDVLNEETPKEMRVFMTVAVDLVFANIREPVRFILETKARVYPRNERFWYFSKKQIKDKYFMHLKPAMLTTSTTNLEQQYEVKDLISETTRERRKSLNLSLNRGYHRHTASSSSDVSGGKTPNDDDEEETDDEAPMVSGSGHVSKEITDADLLDAWADVLKKWHANLTTRPKQVLSLSKRGIPEALRGEVWQLLAGCHHSEDLIEAYRILMTKESPCEDVILRDMHRTFPAHEFFNDAQGVGQDTLFRLNRAYSVYDAEVGYCQGLSFLVAALLLHMPEEQAFALLVKIMFDYQLRNFYKDGFHDLHLRFYQLERLLQHHIPDLYNHLLDMQLEAHMYASQWFLTLFTAKFPLYLVYRIIDLFLCNGINTVFNVAIGLLKDSRRELLALDFEGVLKFFRVSLPKKYRSEKASQQLLDIALKTKINTKKLQKYEQEYLAIQAAQIKQEDPVERFERENKRLIEANMRLEQENDLLAHELVTSKVSLRNDLDSAEDSVEALSKRLAVTTAQRDEAEEMVKRLTTENSYLKEKYRTDVGAAEEEQRKNKEIIAQYKEICSKMSERIEKSSVTSKEEVDKLKDIISKCTTCSEAAKSMTLPSAPKSDQPEASKDKKIRELELELARTKLEKVQLECRNQEMSHELKSKADELTAAKNNWWNKGITTIRDAVNRKGDST